MAEGILFDIQRLSVGNGPGIRTTAFLKGCQLRCAWCHNPESHAPEPDLKYMKNICHFCGHCARACESGALALRDGALAYDGAACTRCGACSRACPYGAMKISGYRIGAEALAALFLRDKEYYDASGGGITLSGGEPMAQPDFLGEVLELSGQMGLATCVDTSGYCPDGAFAAMLEKTDMVLFDVKHMDPARHLEYTGVDNAQIFQNLITLAGSGKPFCVRFPMIPGYNDDEENIARTCAMLRGLHVESVDVSVFHDYYLAKYAQMFRPEDAPDIRPYTEEEIDQRLELIARHGVKPNRV
ncbi:MAG: glycyl-radical enzyme activating protein [Clostridiales Family XIII bacterium]|jgi:pyruvate formate lyase activating enzyme|nr:glycyl-radical enzyme activating protein [Clostridiales Family XIII bacterium]